MKKIIIAAALVLATPAAAQVACFPGDYACQHQQWHNRQHENFNEGFFGNKAGIPQGGQSIFDIIVGIGNAARAQEEHEMRMKLMEQQRQLQIQQQRQQQARAAAPQNRAQESLAAFNQFLAGQGIPIGRVDAASTEKVKGDFGRASISDRQAACDILHAQMQAAYSQGQSNADDFIVPMHTCIKLGHLTFGVQK